MPHYLTDDNSVHLCFFFPWQYLNCFAFELWSLSDYNLMSAEYRVKSYATYCILWWQRNPSVHYASHMIVTTCPFVKEKHENGSICIKENFAQIIEITPVQYWNTTLQSAGAAFSPFLKHSGKITASTEIGRRKVMWSAHWIDITLCTPDPVSVDCYHLAPLEQQEGLLHSDGANTPCITPFLNNEWVIL